VSLTDDEQKLVFSRLGGELRVAGTAEFAGYDTSLDETRCQAIAHILSGRQPEVDFDFLGGRAGSRPLLFDSKGPDAGGSATGTRPEASFTERRAPH
jgi:hypothetical protein